jgi:predicted helicase
VSGIEKAKKWTMLTPNDSHDWINQRDPAFESFYPIGSSADTDCGVFAEYSPGISTNRDTWIYSFSRTAVLSNMRRLTEFAKSESIRFHAAFPSASRKELEDSLDEFLDGDRKRVAWSVNLKKQVLRNAVPALDSNAVQYCSYRPFCKQYFLNQTTLIERPGKSPAMLPSSRHGNAVICVTAAGNRVDFSATITNLLSDYHFVDKSGGSQCFPLHVYEKVDESTDLKFDKSDIIDGYRRRDVITDVILKAFRAAYGKGVTKEDIFYYVYGVLHSQEYRTRFAADLKKMLPRIPLTQETKDFRAFSDAGRRLAEWHLNYETIEPWPVQEHNARFEQAEPDPFQYYRVQKMTFARPTPEQKQAGEKHNKTTIIYNSDITITKIPLEAYEYVVNGKPAIEWIMERYQYTRDKDSGIVNDPNDWSKEHDQPRYILDLLKRVVRVSLETMKIVKDLPALNERNRPDPTETRVR